MLDVCRRNRRNGATQSWWQRGGVQRLSALLHARLSVETTLVMVAHVVNGDDVGDYLFVALLTAGIPSQFARALTAMLTAAPLPKSVL